MENHSTALRVWQEHNVRDARCVHLDAHLDVGWMSKPTADLAGLGGPGLAALRERDCFLHTQEGHFDIASWLGVAFRAGMVRELFWVVPDEVWFENARQLQELLTRQVGQVSSESFIALEGTGGPYQFATGSTDVFVCRLGQLPPLRGGRLLLDVDLDYFARYRHPGVDGWAEPWTDPVSVAAELYVRVPRVEVTTVSVSWNGGYVPSDMIPRFDSLCEAGERLHGGDVWHRSGLGREGPYADYTRACGMLHRGRPAEAMRYADRAVSADPAVGAYHYVAALSAAGVGDFDGAARARERCLSTGSVESAQVLNDFAGMLARSGEVSEALALQEEAFAVDQADSPIISANLMALYVQVGNWDRAREMASATIDRQPFNSDSVVVLATAAQHYDELADAAALWERAAELALDERLSDGYRRRAARLHSR